VPRAATPAAAGQRLDSWLWAARFYKTRSLAKAAISAGRVRLNGVVAKPSKTLRCGDCVHLRKGEFQYELTVDALQSRRVSPAIARTLYRESEESVAERQRISERSRAQWASRPQPQHRPDKRGRGRIRQFKRGE